MSLTDTMKVELVQTTWAKVATEEKLGDNFFAKFFEMDPSARHYFRTDISIQGATLVSSLSKIMVNIGDEKDKFNAYMVPLGASHARRGIPETYYNSFGKAWLFIIEVSLTAKNSWFDDIRISWIWAMEKIMNAMNKAHQDEYKQNKLIIDANIKAASIPSPIPAVNPYSISYTEKSINYDQMAQSATSPSGTSAGRYTSSTMYPSNTAYTTGYGTTGYGTTGYGTTGYGTTGYSNTGYSNTGYTTGGYDFSKPTPTTSISSNNYQYRQAEWNDVNSHVDNLDSFLKQFTIFDTISEKTSISRSFIFLGFLAFSSMILLSSHGPDLICNLFGFLYPAYATYKTLRREAGYNEGDFWLMYWVVFGLFTVMENVFDPYFDEGGSVYLLFKCLFLLWAFLPQTKGASMIFSRFVLPVERYENRIDAFARDAYNNLRKGT